jgi:hypothetical protein
MGSDFGRGPSRGKPKSRSSRRTEGDTDPDLWGGSGIIRHEKHDARRKLEGSIETMLRMMDAVRDYALFALRGSHYFTEEDPVSVLKQDAFFKGTVAEIILQGMREGIISSQEPFT